MIKQFARIAAFLCCASAATVAAQEKLTLGGAGTMGNAVDALVQGYREKKSSDAIEVIDETMSTTGGIEGTKSGRLTIGIVARELNEKEKKNGLVYRAVTRFPVVVGMHKSLPVINLSDAQVCDIFSGKIKSWKDVGGGDAKIVVVGRTKDDNNIETFREQMTCFKTLQLTADAVLLVRGGEVLDALNNRPGTVSIISAAGSHDRASEYQGGDDRRSFAQSRNREKRQIQIFQRSWLRDARRTEGNGEAVHRFCHQRRRGKDSREIQQVGAL